MSEQVSTNLTNKFSRVWIGYNEFECVVMILNVSLWAKINFKEIDQI